MQPRGNALISIIMPVYNAEKTLPATVDSVLQQTYPHLELILVDDGSKDDSLRLCRKFQEKDSRIKVLTQENQGPAAARNTAIQAMTGDFVLFADSDDLLVPQACQLLLDAIGENELALAHYYFDLGTVSSPRGLLQGNRSLSEAEFLDQLVRRPGSFYFSALWNKLYRAELIRQNSLRFDSFLSWGEDFAFNMQYYRAIRNGVSLVEEPVYHYIKRPHGTSLRSLIHVAHSCRIKWRLYRHFKSLYQEKGLYDTHRALIRRYIWNVTLAN